MAVHDSAREPASSTGAGTAVGTNGCEQDTAPTAEARVCAEPHASPRADAGERTLLAAERSVLGAVLMHPGALAEAVLTPADFLEPRHALIYRACVATHAEHGRADPLLVADELRRRDRLVDAGGVDMLIDLSESVVTAAGVADYAALVREGARRRRVVEAVQDALQRAREGAEADELVDVVRRVVEGEKAPTANHGEAAGDTVQQWATAGPLVHVTSGIPALDAMTNGGPTLGYVLVLNGQPGSAKTAAGVQLADAALRQGACVGMLAIDEDADGIVTRLLQRRGFTRQQCEQRTAQDIAAMLEQMRPLRLRSYDGETTIEAAAASIAEAARAAGTFGVLVIDSLQTARCDAEHGASSRYETITQCMLAARRVAAKHRLLVVVVSEMNRGGYKATAGKDRVADMAASSGSGAIEYGAQVAVALRPHDVVPDLIEASVFKNKLGRRHGKDECILLQLDRDMQLLTEARAPMGPTDADVRREQERELRAGLQAMAAKVLEVMAELGGTVDSKEDVYERMVGKTPRKRAGFAECIRLGQVIEKGRGNQKQYVLVARPGDVKGSPVPPPRGEGERAPRPSGVLGGEGEKGRERGEGREARGCA